MEWLKLPNANQSTLDGVVDSLNNQPIHIRWIGSQFQMPTNLHWIELLTILKDDQCTLDGVVHNFKSQPIYIG